MEKIKRQISLNAELIKAIRASLFWAPALLIASIFSSTAYAEQAPQDRRPNVVIMLIDDAALMDLGVYGGEAQTPNIDSLANSGVFFTQYRTTPLCAPSRAMLLTGLDNHQTGVATIPEILPEAHIGKPGYAMHLEDGVDTIATFLRNVGYQTFMTGKWHLGSGEGQLPVEHGFDRSFILDASGADNWEQKSYIPYYLEAPWFEDEQPATLPDNFYSSEFIIDKMIDYLDEGDANKPFFAFLGFQAIHIPVQAPRELTEKYLQTYRDGWEPLRAKRAQRAKQLGLIPATAETNPFLPGSRLWSELSAEDQTLYAARMAVNAAMLEAMDIHIGRMIDHLKANGKFDNTIFVVASDNGPASSLPEGNIRFDIWLRLNGYHKGIENIGEKGSYAYIGPEWAQAAAGNSHMFKFYASEGGVRAPLILAGPGIPATGTALNARSWVSDITPTILALTDTQTDTPINFAGKNLRPILNSQVTQVYSADDSIGMEVSGNSALYRGAHKLVRHFPPLGDKQWRLYNIEQDPGETNDLSQVNPELFQFMLAEYDQYSKNVGVQPMPDNYNSFDQITKNITKKRSAHLRAEYGYQVIGFLAVAISIIAWMIVRRRRKST